MKRNIFLLIFGMITGVSLAATLTITNADYTFSPANVTIGFGDTVIPQAGIESLASFQKCFLLYPDPAKGKLKLKYPGGNDNNFMKPFHSRPMKLEILTVEGKKWYAVGGLNLRSDFSFDLSTLPGGIFIVRIIAGRKNCVTLLIKE